MSSPLAPAALRAVVQALGTGAWVLSVGPDGRPRASSAEVVWPEGLPGQDHVLQVRVGAHTARNVAEHPLVTLLWPQQRATGSEGSASLIIDGTALEIRHEAGEAGSVQGARRPGAILDLRVDSSRMHARGTTQRANSRGD